MGKLLFIYQYGFQSFDCSTMKILIVKVMHAFKKSSNNEEVFKIESGSPSCNKFPAS